MVLYHPRYLLFCNSLQPFLTLTLVDRDFYYYVVSLQAKQAYCMTTNDAPLNINIHILIKRNDNVASSCTSVKQYKLYSASP